MSFEEPNGNQFQSTPIDEGLKKVLFEMDRARDIRNRNLVVEELEQLTEHCKVILQPPNNTQVEVLQASLEFMLSHFERLNTLNRALWTDFLIELEELRADRNRQNTFVLQVRVVMCQLRRAIGQAENPLKPDQSSDEQRASGCQTRCCEKTKNARKLEPLKMDKFDGKLENWLPWWARFQDRIHNDQQLNDRTKYDYLLQYLSKEVKERLRTIPLDEAFYMTALNRLKADFGNHEKLLTLYTQRLAAIRPIASQFDATGLRELLQVVHTSLSALEKIGMPKDSLAPTVFQSLKENLPLEIYLGFKASMRGERASEASDSSSSTIANADKLNRLLAFVESAVLDLDDVPEPRLQRQATAESRKVIPTTIALKTEFKPISNRKNDGSRRTNNASDQKSTQQPCVFCKSNEHRTQACTDTSTTVQEKRDLLMREDRCRKCSRKGHRAAMCRSVPFCSKCNRKGHMTPLCNPVSTFTAHCSNSGTGDASRGCTHDQSATKYFITVLAAAIGPSGLKQRVRILFDSGSQSSFVKTAVAARLGVDLKSATKIPVSLKMLNQATVSTSTSQINLRLQSQNGGPIQNFKFYTLDQICGGQVQPQIDRMTKEQLRKLNIELSDSLDGHIPIDILVGADQLVSVQTHNAHRLDRALEVVETAFGWALFGQREIDSGRQVEVNHVQIACLHCSVPQIEPIIQHETLDRRFQDFVEAETLAIEDEPRDKDQQFIESFMERVTFDPETHRFTAELPVKENMQPGLNLNLAKARLRSLNRSLIKAGTRKKYQAEIQAL